MPKKRVLEIDEVCIADAETTRALNEQAQPLGRTILSVAVIAVANAIQSRTDLVVRNREHGMRARLASMDEETPFLVRLLDANLESLRGQGTSEPVVIELGEGRPGDLPWLVTIGSSITLGLASSGAREAMSLPSVTHRAHQCLKYLAAPGGSSRWTAPLPGFADPSPIHGNNLSRRWNSRRFQEASAAAGLLTAWLALDELPREGATPEGWWMRLGMSPEVRPLLETWVRWLRNQHVLADEGDLLRPGEALPLKRQLDKAWAPPVKNMVATLIEHETLILKVLAGDAPSSSLLEIAGLRPGQLVAAEPELEPAWERIEDILSTETSLANQALRVADLGGACSDNPHLAAALTRLGIGYTSLQAGKPHATTAPFDVVLAVGTLHRWPDPRDAVSTVASLLRPGGCLIALENTELSPLGLLIAGLLENGFTDASGGHVDTPTQDENTWSRLLESAGLHAITFPTGPTPAVLIHALKTSDSSREDTGDPITGAIRAGTETEIARVWSELLGNPPRNRMDSFFELGGDSLRATQFIASMRQRYGVRIAMRELFAHPMLGAIAQRIDEAILEASDDVVEEGVV